MISTFHAELADGVDTPKWLVELQGAQSTVTPGEHRIVKRSSTRIRVDFTYQYDAEIRCSCGIWMGGSHPFDAELAKMFANEEWTRHLAKHGASARPARRTGVSRAGRGAEVTASEAVDLVSPAEIAVRLKVKAQTVAAWKLRGRLPAPLVTLSSVPIWHWSTIEQWAIATGRRAA